MRIIGDLSGRKLFEGEEDIEQNSDQEEPSM